MAIRNILTEDKDADFLAKTCRPVSKFDKRLSELLDDMGETLHSANGVGLAGIQVGVLRRICVIDTYDGTGVRELVNPVIMKESGEQDSLEGCLSVPGKWGITKRPAHVKVRAQNRKGDFFEYEGDDLLATVSCHEIDHLDGHLFLEHVVRMLSEEEADKIAHSEEK